MSGKIKSASDIFSGREILELVGLLDTVKKTGKMAICVDFDDTKDFAGWRVTFEDTKKTRR